MDVQCSYFEGIDQMEKRVSENRGPMLVCNFCYGKPLGLVDFAQ